jgi:hypothetical protein
MMREAGRPAWYGSLLRIVGPISGPAAAAAGIVTAGLLGLPAMVAGVAQDGTPATVPGLAPSQGLEAQGSIGEAEALFLEGNRQYQENDFAGALAAYRAVRAAGFEGVDLYYNLANAHFKTGNLARAILNYERALRLDPGNADARANLDLARSMTPDAIEPMPRFWLLSALDWWVDLLPRSILAALATLTWLTVSGGLCLRILSRGPGARPLGNLLMAGGGAGLLLFGITLLAKTGAMGDTEWGVILSQEVAVQSAPSAEDDLTLFRIHEGTKVRLDQRTSEWSEIVLEDGRVGWVPTDSLEEI